MDAREPHIAADAPPAWVAAEITRPPLADSSGASWASWNGWRSPAKDAVLVTACVAAPVPGWVEDMRPAFSARAVALAGATASQIAGFGVETFADAEGNADWLGLRATGGGPTLGHARTFLGFGGTNAHACFVVCASPNPNGAALSCNEVVVHARLEGGDAPPQPGVALRAVTWGVHHPSTAAMAFAAATLLGAVLAVVTRRKPRARG
jgi:hypothetical protein